MKHKVKVMGILNITPDSFYSKSTATINTEIERALDNMKKSDIIDIGCESSRPGASSISIEEEINRLSNFVPFIKNYPNLRFSIDTYKYDVAKFALSNGFDIVNDITGGEDSKLLELISEMNASIIIMHMLGKPQTMQNSPTYIDVVNDIIHFLNKRANNAISCGIKRDNIYIDPGIGFGKTIFHNDEIVRNIQKFKEIGYAVVYGISRKSFLQYESDTPDDRLPATLGVSSYLAQNKVDILRTHDVDATISMLSSLERIVNY